MRMKKSRWRRLQISSLTASDYHLYSVAEFVDRPELSARESKPWTRERHASLGRTLEHGDLLHYETDRNSARRDLPAGSSGEDFKSKARLAQRMHASGESASTIAATMGVSRATAYRVLAESAESSD